ncbi:MAG: hypothetical protein HOV94_43025 [Saccharothrix sp.]|nr:hypothetical protein [Saccharothrix sp.]
MTGSRNLLERFRAATPPGAPVSRGGVPVDRAAEFDREPARHVPYPERPEADTDD